ncbi:MAG: 3-deoxy-manno-octulosonate cytidylyltransferase [Candidatus Omnitrophica bacterium]|nr:3-deoxy-manno-octulosonate cytidylyltransferase [Candidatus Omnitrophota bacterium]
MKVIGVIPARWGSTRFEGKVLALIAGKPMIEHVWLRVKKSKILNDIIIACDDEKVLKTAVQFGAKAVLTSPNHPSGTDRIAEVVKDLDVDIVVNIQGDEPLIQHAVIDNLANALMSDQSAVMSTVIKRLEKQEELDNPNVVKAVIDEESNALYFSRAAIPYNRDKKDFKALTYYKHLGIYAYRKNFLLKLKDLPPSLLEKTEKLEQLRVLEAGYKIKAILTDLETIGVDTKEDLKLVEAILQKG